MKSRCGSAAPGLAVPRYGSSVTCWIAGWEQQQPGCGREGCEVGMASSHKVHLEQTDDSSAGGARGHAGLTVPRREHGRAQESEAMKGWCGASGALESTHVRVLSPTLWLTLGTSATGCSGGKQETATSNALSS